MKPLSLLETHEASDKKSTGSSSSHPPISPLLFSSLAPSASLLRPERPPRSALLSSCCSGERLSSQLVNIGLRERGSSSEMLLMATWSKKILVLGWAPPDKEDVVEHGVVDGDLVQEDLSTWMGTTCPTSTSQSVLHTHSRHRSLFIFCSRVHQISRSGWCVVDADPLVYLVRHGIVEEFLCFE